MATAFQPSLRIVAGLALVAAGGCATRPPTAQEQAARWLSDSPRSIAIRVEPELPAPAVVTYDHKVGRRVLHGAGGAGVGALYAVGAGCTLGPLGCLLGVIVAPVGAVIGGIAGVASVKSDQQRHAPEAAQGSPTLFALSAESMALPTMLAAALAVRGKAGGHALYPSAIDRSEEAALELRFTALHLVGDVGEDPAVALEVAVSAGLRTPAATAYSWGTYTYTGTPRRVSEWQANDARQFRAEIALALDSIASEAAAHLRSPSAR